MPFISDEEYAQLMAMRNGGGQMEARRFDAAPVIRTPDQMGWGQQMAQAWQNWQPYAQQQAQPNPMAVGRGAAEGVAEYAGTMGAYGQQAGVQAQWNPTAGAGGGYWRLPPGADLGAWAKASEQAQHAVYGEPAGNMGGMQSAPSAPTGGQRAMESGTHDQQAPRQDVNAGRQDPAQPNPFAAANRSAWGRF